MHCSTRARASHADQESPDAPQARVSLNHSSLASLEAIMLSNALPTLARRYDVMVDSTGAASSCVRHVVQNRSRQYETWIPDAGLTRRQPTAAASFGRDYSKQFGPRP